mmetsp:Transcript_25292/g.39104  ORF Transcript_25292/g.39104 Transcript_25292/m.39104 type:complete len:102 (+) Transcript_25292:2675-2980(+)
MEGGGINWRDTPPIFSEDYVIEGNRATLYGNNNASYAVRLVRFDTVIAKVNEEVIGERAQDHFTTYLNTAVDWAEKRINMTMAERTEDGSEWLKAMSIEDI